MNWDLRLVFSLHDWASWPIITSDFMTLNILLHGLGPLSKELFKSMTLTKDYLKLTESTYLKPGPQTSQNIGHRIIKVELATNLIKCTKLRSRKHKQTVCGVMSICGLEGSSQLWILEIQHLSAWQVKVVTWIHGSGAAWQCFDWFNSLSSSAFEDF